MISEIAAAVGILDFAIDTFERFSRKPAQFSNTYANPDYAALGQALNLIHFGPDGVLDVLRAMAAEKPITTEHRNRIFQFNEIAPEVSIALRKLLAAYNDEENLSLEDRGRLNSIAKIKDGARWDICQIANHAINMDAPYDPADIAKLVDRIEQLNSAIEGAEKALRRQSQI